jgi:hypothetical protein
MAPRRAFGGAAAVAIVAFALYHSTLLPGFDFGDTGSFQATVGSPVVDARKAYPLYFAIGRAAVWITGAEPARALNLASAVEAAIACGIFVLVAAELSGSVIAAIGASLLFAASYTFWSQAIIAEVYALHALFIAVTLLLLLRWQRRPTLPRLGLFFAAYALGFGNHLSMILLAPAYALFLLLSAPGGWRSMLMPRTLLLAAACAAAGALQYAGMVRALWLTPQPPHGIVDALQAFWFDVTKSDWRDTTVLTVPRSMIGDRAAMYWFDLRQQFGIIVPILAVVGIMRLAVSDGARAALLAVLYLVNVAFAYSYNVGDSHVFYLPSHAMIALLTAAGVGAAGRLLPRTTPILGVLLVAYAGMRAYIDKPALDRSHDVRPTEVMSALTAGVDDQRSILLTDVNWQLLNGLAYFAKVVRPEVAFAWLPDVRLYAPAFVRDNTAIGRQMVLTALARDDVARSYGPLFHLVADRPATPTPLTLHDFVRALRPGTSYVLCVLKPTREYAFDRSDLTLALQALTASDSIQMPDGDYAVVAGVTAAAPLLAHGANRPFARLVAIAGMPVDIRMDSWLAADTIRRMGFGHVVAARHHTLVVERGISIVTFGAGGWPSRTGYFANLFASEPRYLIDTTDAFR